MCCAFVALILLVTVFSKEYSYAMLSCGVLWKISLVTCVACVYTKKVTNGMFYGIPLKRVA